MTTIIGGRILIVIVCMICIPYVMYLDWVFPMPIFMFGPSLVGAAVLAGVAYIASFTPKEAADSTLGAGVEESSALVYVVSAAWLFFGITGLGVLAFYDVGSPIDVSDMTFVGMVLTTLASLFIGLPCILLQVVACLVMPIAIGFAVGIVFPFFLTGLVAIGTTSPTLEATRSHAKMKMPSDEIERKIAEAMERDMADEAKIMSLINELPLLLRIKYIIRYRAMAGHYKSMRDVMNAQKDMMNERTRTARSAHEAERERRRNRDGES